MTEYDTTPGAPIPTPEPQATAGTEPGTEPTVAWSDVVRSLDELGSAVTMWARAMKDDPENRRRAKELQERLEGYGRQIGDTVDAAARSDFAREVTSAAMAAGDVAIDTARRVGDEIAPRVANALRAVSDNIRRAAEASQERSATPAVEAEPAVAAPEAHPAPEPAPYTGEEPPAPSPSGTPDDYVP